VLHGLRFLAQQLDKKLAELQAAGLSMHDAWVMMMQLAGLRDRASVLAEVRCCSMRRAWCTKAMCEIGRGRSLTGSGCVAAAATSCFLAGMSGVLSTCFR
jgi:hypothetical protein